MNRTVWMISGILTLILGFIINTQVTHLMQLQGVNSYVIQAVRIVASGILLYLIVKIISVIYRRFF